MRGFISRVRRSGDGASASGKLQKVRTQLLKAVLIERPLGIGEHEPLETRFEAPGPIVECDPLCVTAAIPVEPGLDLHLAPVVDSHTGVDLRRGADDPRPGVGAEIPLQLLDAFGQSPIANPTR